MRSKSSCFQNGNNCVENRIDIQRVDFIDNVCWTDEAVIHMNNKLAIFEQNNIMNNYVKTDDIVKDMCGIIESSRNAAYQAVNTALVQRNWLIGYRITTRRQINYYGCIMVAKLLANQNKLCNNRKNQ